MALQFINQVGQSSKIYYDDEVCNYVKVYAKHAWYTRRGIKRALGILLTPGKNMEYITQRLLQAGIHCPELVDIEDYKVTFKECKNTQTLREYRAVHGHNALRVEQIEIFAQLFKADLLHADPHDSNFLYDGEKIIVIDVDALVCSPWKFLPRQLVLYRIWRHSACDYDFADLVAQRWKDRTIFQRLVDNIYTLRTYLKVHLLKKKESKPPISCVFSKTNAVVPISWYHGIKRLYCKGYSLGIFHGSNFAQSASVFASVTPSKT